MPQRPVGRRRAHIILGENREAHGVGILTHGEGGGISAGRQSCQLRRAERLAGGKSALKDGYPVLEDGIHALAAKFCAGGIRAMHEHRARHFLANRLRPLGREPRAAAGRAQRQGSRIGLATLGGNVARQFIYIYIVWHRLPA